MIQSQTQPEVARAAELTRSYFQTHAPVLQDVTVLLNVAQDLLVAVEAVTQRLKDQAQAEASQPAEAPAQRVRPVEIRHSITQDALISFIDGKPYKSLKRHLTANGLTPEAYRKRFGLPAEYPMVAPNYAAVRSQIARSIGLGRKDSNASPQHTRRAAAR